MSNSSQQFSTSSVYNDDEDFIIVQRGPIQRTNQQGVQVTFSMGSMQPLVQMFDSQQEIPCVVSISANDQDREMYEQSRPGVDLVCVVDVSGSMSGEKLELCKKTLEFALSILTGKDRLSIVIFESQAYRVTPLKPCHQINEEFFNNKIKQIQVMGGTNIESGLRCGLKVLTDRRVKNQICAIALLTDGKDSSSVCERSRRAIEEANIHDLMIHTFGYGKGHDSNLLMKISELTYSSYLSIENYESIGQAFSNCLGLLTSLVAENIQIQIEEVQSDPEIRITKIYTEQGFNFKIPNLISGTQKDTVFVITIPEGDITQTEKEVLVARAHVTFVLAESREPQQQDCDLTIRLLSQSSTIEDIPIVDDIYVHYLRVQLAEALKNIIEAANNRDFARANGIIDELLPEIEYSHVVQRPLVQEFIRDLNDAKNRVRDQSSWQSGGLAQLGMLQKSHQFQEPSAVSLAYANQAQTDAYEMSAHYVPHARQSQQVKVG